MTRPDLLSNFDDAVDWQSISRHPSVGAGLLGLLEDNRTSYGDYDLAVATAYFNPAGWEVLEPELKHTGHVRILLGVEPAQELPRPRPLHRAHHPEEDEEERLARALEGHQRDLEADRDLLGFDAVSTDRVRRMVAWLRQGNVEVRRLPDRFLHGKAFLTALPRDGEPFREPRAAVVGSANLTRAGLTSNLELNLSRYDVEPCESVAAWFASLWEEAEPFDLAGLYEERFKEHEPRLIWLKMLWEKYGESLVAEADGEGVGLRLAEFQKHGVERARGLLARNNGVIVSDGVGLGKTYTAGELVRETVHNRQRALVIVPKSLAATWRQFLSDHGLAADVSTIEQIRSAWQYPEERRRYLWREPDEYTTVVVDEAHTFRNPVSQQAQALHWTIEGDPPKRVVLLTATPVNNSLMDLYQLIRLFAPNDAQFADRGVPSLIGKFREAAAKTADELDTSDLFDVVSAVMVKRTRRFVKEHYRGATVWVNGEERPIEFPDPVVTRVNYSLSEVIPGFFDRFARALGHDPDEQTSPTASHDEPVLTLARYTPSRYRLDGDVEQNERQVAGLLRSGLLKRFESSAIAFAVTCERMAASHDDFLEVLDSGRVATAGGIEEWKELQASDDPTGEPFSDDLDDARFYDTEELRADVAADRDLLREFAAEARRVRPETDPKLAALADELAHIARQAEDEAGELSARNLRKALVFTYFADTADWVTAHLQRLLDPQDPLHDPRLHAYRDRLAVVHGHRGDTDRAAEGFAPEHTGGSSDQHDLLVTTDVLAQGVNLQQARHVINYDLPWNPMRLVQRHGRVDRIGSPHTEVFLRCFFPDKELDDVLELLDRLERKITQAAAAVGVEGEVLPGSRTSEMVLTDPAGEARSLADGDASLFERGGTKTEAASDEDFRQELRQAIADPELREQIETLPWGSGSGVVRGERTAFVFCARIGDHDEPWFRTVEADGHGELRVSDSLLGALLTAQTRPGEPPRLDEGTHQLAYDAWAAASDDIHARWTEATDPRRAQPEIPRAFRDAIDLLLMHPPPEVLPARIDTAVAALSSPYPRSYARVVREALDSEDTPEERARRVLEAVDELRMQPADLDEALPNIARDDIHLVAWLAIVPFDGD